MPSAKLSGLAIAEGLAGFILFWSGLRNQTLKTTVTDLLSGTVPQDKVVPTPTIGLDSSSSPTGGSGSASSGGGSTAPAAPSNPTGNVATGKLMAAAYGWTGAQWNALYALWERESGWSNTAQNSGSGAYGIPQSLPYTKMPKAAWPPADGGSASPSAQISWGLSYIKSRYGSPEAAWAHEESNGWY